MPPSGATCAGDMFWTSSVVPLLMVVLHLLRDVIVPHAYQLKFLCFYAKPRHDHQVSVTDKEHREKTSSESQSLEAENQQTELLFQNDFITLTKGHRLSAQLDWNMQHISRNIVAPQPDRSVIGSFMLGALLQGLQFALFNHVSRTAARLAANDNVGKIFALSLLIFPTVISLLSFMLFIREVEAAVKDERMKTRWCARAVLKVLDWWNFMMLTFCLVPWNRVLFA